MDFDFILVILVIAFIIISLYRELFGPAFTFIIGVIVLGIAGILSPGEILAGFANEQIAVIIMLLLLGDIIRRTALLEALFDRVFRRSSSYRSFMTRMMIVVGSFSAFLNNTPLVAIMMPYVHSWSKRNRIAPSKLLIPLSYAAILGGCATLIGTSTNLMVNGLVIDQKIIPGLKPLGLFDFAYVGIPMIIIGMVYMVFAGTRILPEKPDAMSSFTTKQREYLVEVQVKQGSHLSGKTIEKAGFRNLQGLFLVEIIKKGYSLSPVAPDVIISDEDILIFAGDTETIADMVGSHEGLRLTQVGMYTKKTHTELIEVVVSHNSSLINKTVKEAHFRAKYDAAIIAVHRNGERLSGKIGTLRLKAGDVLLLIAGIDFQSRASDTLDFYQISKIRDFRKLEFYKVLVLIGGTVLAIALSALGLFPLFMGLIVLLITLILFKIASPKDLPKSVDYNLALIISLSLALGTAMIKTGFAEKIAQLFITLFFPLGIIGVLSGIYLITAILASYITNKAAVAIIFPIALAMSVKLGLDPVPFILIVSYASAANFMTPIGYQTNLMVYGPGSYTFNDFFRIGFPLTLIYMVVSVIILALVFGLV